MKLIADSGGSKTAWFLVHAAKVFEGPETTGINLNVVTPEVAREGLQQSLLPALKKRPVEELHFYGAGLGLAAHQDSMRAILMGLFPEAKVEVYHDLLGAARATCGRARGMVCILGTGSNACLYDGHEITEQRGGHGWLFDDQGGGTDLGRHLLRAALREDMPADLLTAFQAFVGVALLDLRTAIYRSDRPNAALARLAPFLAAHRTTPFIGDLLHERFTAFLQNTILRWNPGDQPIHFVGSIAGSFKTELEKACQAQNLKIGTVLPAPGKALANFHLS